MEGYGKCKQSDAPFFDVVYHDLTQSLSVAESAGCHTIEAYKQALDIIAQAMEQLRLHVYAHGFGSLEEEIIFFKSLKPKVESLHLYYHHLFEIEIAKTNASQAYDEAVLRQQMVQISNFFETHVFLLRYYRSGATYLDDKLFVRTPTDGSWMPIDGVCDTMFTAVCDKFIATLWAYEKLGEYINQCLQPAAAVLVKDMRKMQWTDSKAALIELLYALQRKGSINNGQAELKDIAAFFETVFGIDLGNYYRAFQEIRIRKSGPTNYLDQLKKVLLQYMDETDLHYKG